MRIPAKPAEDSGDLVVQHRMAADVLFKIRLLLRVGQFPVQQQIADFHEIGLIGQLLDRVAAVIQQTFFPIDVGDL